MAALNDQQKFVLDSLDKAESTLNTHEVAELIRKQFADSPHGYYNRARSVLARLRKRGLVGQTRVGGKVSSWNLTAEGKAALAG